MRNSELENIDVILFDLDDTLFNQQKAHRRTLNQIKNSHEFFDKIDLEEMLEAFKEADSEAIDEFRNGVPMEDLRLNRSRRFLKKLGVNEDLAETFHEEFYRIYPYIPVEIEGAEEVVRYLNSKYALGILTNSTEQTQMKKLQTLELAEYFNTFIFSEGVGSRKPDEEIFRKALEKVEKNSNQCLYVGNSFRSDIKGAEKVGMWTCWLNRDGKEKGDEISPDLEIRELGELLKIL